MKTKTLELKGWIRDLTKNERDVYITPSPDEWPDESRSIGFLVSERFRKISKPVRINLNSWETGEYIEYKDVFMRYFVTDKETTWDEANEMSIKHMAGTLETEEIATGYSELTIVQSWVDLLVGGHDIRRELASYDGKYVIIRIDYKIK